MYYHYTPRLTKNKYKKKSSLHCEDKNFDNLSNIYIFFCTQLLYKPANAFNKKTKKQKLTYLL